MDQRLKEALEFANYQATVHSQKETLRRRYQNALKLYYNDGMFEVTPELVSFLHALVASGTTETVIIDRNKNPIYVEMIGEFYETVLEMYHAASNEFYNDFVELAKSRNVKKVVQFDQ